MSALYELTNTSKQGLHQYNRLRECGVEPQQEVIRQADAIRKIHPKMGCRVMYSLMKDVAIGRDLCEAMLLSLGYRVKRRINYIKTTRTQGKIHYPDLIKGRIVTGINQVWQTDITYYLSAQTVLYIIFIIDVYSRRIIAHSANNNMKATANLSCLKKAFKTRSGYNLKNLIHHSDRGSQYKAHNYLAALNQKGIQISMSKQAWQNAYTERINGTIKNDYLYARDISNLTQLRKTLNRDVNAYNQEKPHSNLIDKMSPMKFEEYLKQTPKRNHPKLKIYDYEDR